MMITKAWQGSEREEIESYWSKGTKFQIDRKNRFWDLLPSKVTVVSNVLYISKWE